MLGKGSLLAMAAAVMLSGCVAKSDSLAKVAEMDGLRQEMTGVEDRKKAAEKALAAEKQKNAGLEKKVAELEKEKTSLLQENANVKNTENSLVAELRLRSATVPSRSRSSRTS